MPPIPRIARSYQAFDSSGPGRIPLQASAQNAIRMPAVRSHQYVFIWVHCNVCGSKAPGPHVRTGCRCSGSGERAYRRSVSENFTATCATNELKGK